MLYILWFCGSIVIRWQQFSTMSNSFLSIPQYFLKKNTYKCSDISKLVRRSLRIKKIDSHINKEGRVDTFFFFNNPYSVFYCLVLMYIGQLALFHNLKILSNWFAHVLQNRRAYRRYDSNKAIDLSLTFLAPWKLILTILKSRQ